MAIYKIKNLSFTYPNRQNMALNNINLNIEQGEFICICGKSGCGKTTLLRLMKTAVSPFGAVDGKILFMNKSLAETESKIQASKIGFVMQSPENQIVTDKVWHELAFGLESLGYHSDEIRTKVAEMAAFFGISDWFHKSVEELSGGQKQILNLASVMVMQPSVLILDEPTSQLDPIAASEFLKILEKINREIGTTVIISEHRLEDVIPISDRVVVMDEGSIIACDKPENIGGILKDKKHPMEMALPTPMRIYSGLQNDLRCPLTIRDGRVWLENYINEKKITPSVVEDNKVTENKNAVIELRDVWFRYEKDSPDVLRGLNLEVNQGEIFAVLGSNGSGKTTMLSVIGGIENPYRGRILIDGEEISKISNIRGTVISALPQNPQSLFVKKTVYLDLLDMLTDKKILSEEKDKRIKNIAKLCRIDKLLDCHPYDLSGGEMQRAALAKVLLQSPEILLMDEPTKGFDAHFKQIFEDILLDLKGQGVTIIMVSHDLEFCAEISDRCAMFFDGGITSSAQPRDFFSGNNFYTTSANRMARGIIENAILPQDIILALGGKIQERKREKMSSFYTMREKRIDEKPKKEKKMTPFKIVIGIISLILFIVFCFIQQGFDGDESKTLSGIIQVATGITLAGGLLCFMPERKVGTVIQQPRNKRKLSMRTLIAMLFVLIAVPLTIFVGIYFFGDRKYYFISMLIIFETFLPFCMVFEDKKPQARELVLICVLSGIAIAGRMAFFMLPQFKPLLAIIIIVGICFGAETGFLVGAIAGFVSNFFLGQGPWTPWQMLALGMVGFISGILFKIGVLRRTKLALCIFGILATVIIYGGILNPASVIMMQMKPNITNILAAYAAGIYFDLIHAASTGFFLWFLSEPMIDNLERVKTKYGILDR